MLKQRLITAALLIPIVIGLLLYSSQLAFCLITAVIFMMAAMEWMTLVPLQTTVGRLIYLILFVNLMGALLLVPIEPIVKMTAILSLTILWWLAALIMVIIYPRGTSWWRNNRFIKCLMGAIVLIPCWLSLIFIRAQPVGVLVLLYVLLLIWGADSTAYFAGKRWGKTKLAPAVSPGKSIEGVVGALAFTVVFSTSAAYFSSHPPAIILLAAVGLSIVTVLFSIVGDLFESLLKREAGFKDSGNLLPGHGGLLDRIDSLTAALPVYAFTSMALSMMFTT